MNICSSLLLIFLYLISLSKQDYVYRTEYVDMELDHFTFTINTTFKLRYLINDTYWKPDQLTPIFLYTGNEGDITSFANNTGFLWETAPSFQALILFVEHRYYGESLPFGNLSLKDPKYFGYLSSSQALMDFVKVIYHIKDRYNVTSKKLPVIAFGGSYGGMLSAWIRMKYPSVITGAIASSAPIWQFTGMTPCEAFSRVASSAYSTISKKCSQNIKKSWEAITTLGKTDKGRESLSKIFHTCEPIKNENTVNLIKDYLEDMYVDIAMVNYPYPASFIGVLPANPVKALCRNLLFNVKQDDILLENIYKGVNMYINGTGTVKCFATNSSVDNFGHGGWEIQSCTEMVMPMCNEEAGMFEYRPWNFEDVSNNCYNQYKIRPSKNAIRDLFGGKNIHWASNIIFSNGLLDPWSSGGVLNDLSPSLIAVVIPESAHHLDLRASNERDPASIINARRFYMGMISKWIH